MITNLDPIENDRRERQVCLRRENNCFKRFAAIFVLGRCDFTNARSRYLVGRCQVVMFSLRHQKERWSSFLSQENTQSIYDMVHNPLLTELLPIIEHILKVKPS